MTAEEFGQKLGKIPLDHWLNDPNVTEIFHYCNATALHGIATSKSLWTSDVFSLNDASEVDYAVRLVFETLEKYPRLRPVTQYLRAGTLMSLLRKWDTHVCCFSSEKDSLSQWRAYGEGGYGFAIGFNRQLLEDDARSSKEFGVVQILYSIEQQRKLIEGFLQAASDILATFEPDTNHFVEMIVALVTIILPIKNPGFADEREWRILRFPPTEIFFRPLRGAIVPYSTFAVKPTHFTRIVQGPTLHKDFGERSLRIFLDHNGLAGVPVESSEIPLRSL